MNEQEIVNGISEVFSHGALNVFFTRNHSEANARLYA